LARTGLEVVDDIVHPLKQFALSREAGWRERPDGEKRQMAYQLESGSIQL
jgi:hypothetical protein